MTCRRCPLPAGYVRIHRLIGRRAVSHAASDASVNPWGFRTRMARPHLPGLTHFRTAVDVWDAVRRGLLPAPVRGPWGVAWRLADLRPGGRP